MLDREGYRPNVGIILCNAKNEVFWGKRIREHSWQFPQGGIKRGETPEQAMFRELHEEVGLKPEHVRILGRTKDWLRYDVPTQWIKREWCGSYKAQQKPDLFLPLVAATPFALDPLRRHVITQPILGSTEDAHVFGL